MSNQRKILVLMLISFFAGISQFIIAGVLDKVAYSLGVSAEYAGWLIGAFAISGSIGAPLLALLLSNKSLKRQILYALGIFLCGTFMTSLHLGYGSLLFARVLSGIGTIFFVVVAYLMAASLAGKGMEGKGMSYIALGFSLSQVIGIPIGRMVAGLYGWQTIFCIIGFFVCIGVILIYVFFEEQIITQSSQNLKEQIKIIKEKSVILSLFVTALAFLGFSMITTYLIPLLTSLRNLDAQSITLLFFAFGVASMIGSRMGASIADKVGVSEVILATLAIMIVFSILMKFASFWCFVILLSIWMISIWAFGPTQSLNLAKLLPNNALLLLGLNSSFVQVGFALGAFLGGFCIRHFGISSILTFEIIALSLAFLIFLYLKKSKKYV